LERPDLNIKIPRWVCSAKIGGVLSSPVLFRSCLRWVRFANYWVRSARFGLHLNLLASSDTLVNLKHSQMTGADASKSARTALRCRARTLCS
jgi:hypothetical protein